MLRAGLALVLFGAAFGYLEAAVVAYLRHIYDPLRAALYPNRTPGDLFPLISVEQLSPQHLRLLGIELGREAATLLMLAGAGLLAARHPSQWLAGFAIAFGVWDITFYVFLKVLLGWPASLLTWDILFLIPVPWVGPVLAPVLVSMVMIACGFIALRRDWEARPIQAHPLHWIGLLTGALIIIISFTKDYVRLMSGTPPEHFSWLLFFAGLLLGIGTFAHAWMKRT
jgi:hypothetical protein